MQATRMVVLAALLPWFAPETGAAQSYSVENVRFWQRDDGRVVISYDLHGNPERLLAVRISLFLPDERRNHVLDSEAAIGDIGARVRPGENRQVVWDPRQAFPEGLAGAGFRFIVDARSPARRIAVSWLLAGAAAIGATTLWLSHSAGRSGGLEDLPGPPFPPSR